MPLRNRATAVRAHLDRYLFPEAEPEPSRLTRTQGALLIAALLAFAAFLQVARIGWTASLDSLWAEDGTILLQESLTHGIGHALFAEYNGYLIVAPHLIGEVASAFPLRDAPAVFSILSALVAALSGLAVWFAAAGHIRNPYLRGLLAALTVLTPVGGLETIDSASYVIWYMLVASFWLLLWRPRTQLGAILAAVFIFLTALSTPGLFFFVPLALLRFFAIRDRRDLTIVGAYFAGVLIQLFVVATSSYEQVKPEWTADVWTVLLQRVVDGAALGLRLGGEAWAHLGWPFLIALTVLVVLGLAFGLWRADRSVRYLAALAIPIALAMFVFSIYQRAVATPMLWPADIWNGDGGRYSLVPVMLLLSVVLAIVDRSWRGRDWRDNRSWAGLAVAALLVVSLLVSLPARNLTGRGTPPWSASVAEAERVCSTGQSPEAGFHISPPGFGFQLPCSAVPTPADPEPQR